MQVEELNILMKMHGKKCKGVLLVYNQAWQHHIRVINNISHEKEMLVNEYAISNPWKYFNMPKS